jgi:hypothetical protein
MGNVVDGFHPRINGHILPATTVDRVVACTAVDRLGTCTTKSPDQRRR